MAIATVYYMHLPTPLLYLLLCSVAIAELHANNAYNIQDGKIAVAFSISICPLVWLLISSDSCLVFYVEGCVKRKKELCFSSYIPVVDTDSLPILLW